MSLLIAEGVVTPTCSKGLWLVILVRRSRLRRGPGLELRWLMMLLGLGKKTAERPRVVLQH